MRCPTTARRSFRQWSMWSVVVRHTPTNSGLRHRLTSVACDCEAADGRQRAKQYWPPTVCFGGPVIMPQCRSGIRTTEPVMALVFFNSELCLPCDPKWHVSVQYKKQPVSHSVAGHSGLRSFVLTTRQTLPLAFTLLLTTLCSQHRWCHEYIGLSGRKALKDGCDQNKPRQMNERIAARQPITSDDASHC